MKSNRFILKFYEYLTSLKLTKIGIASAFVFFLIFLCVMAAYEVNYIKNRLPSRPEEKAFLTWCSQYHDKIRFVLNHPIHSKRRSIIEIEFENIKLTDNDIKTYLVNLPVQKITFTDAEITIQGVVLLLDNPYLDYMVYRNRKLGEIETDYDNLQEQKSFLQEQFLKHAENPENDFVSLL